MKLGNSSIISLSFMNIKNSPIFSFSKSLNRQSLDISRLKVFNSFSKILYSSSKTINMRLHQSEFKNTLQSVIHTDSNDNLILIENEKWEKRRESFATGNIEITNCIFDKCINDNASGGAIIALCDTSVSDSKFFMCTAYAGGSLCIYAQLFVKKSIFFECYAVKGGALYNQYACFSMNDTSSDKCAASESGGTYFSHSNIQVEANNNNFTRCSSSLNGAALFISCPSAVVFGNIIVKNMIKRGSGSIYFDNVNRGVLEHSIFHKNSFADIVGGGGSCVEAKGSTSKISIADSLFSQSSDYNYWAIRSREKCSLILVRCRFSAKSRAELSADVDPMIINCTFECKSKINLPKYKIFSAGNALNPDKPKYPYFMIISAVLKFISDLIFVILTVPLLILEIYACYRESRARQKII